MKQRSTFLKMAVKSLGGMAKEKTVTLKILLEWYLMFGKSHDLAFSKELGIISSYRGKMEISYKRRSKLHENYKSFI